MGTWYPIQSETWRLINVSMIPMHHINNIEYIFQLLVEYFYGTVKILYKNYKLNLIKLLTFNYLKDLNLSMPSAQIIILESIIKTFLNQYLNFILIPIVYLLELLYHN